MKRTVLLLLVIFSVSAHAQTWMNVGSGVNGSTHCQTTWNGMLIDGGSFNGPCGRIAGWNGTAWNCFASGVGIVARDAISFNGNLVVCGDFWNVNQPCTNCNGIASWDGTSWTPLGTGFNNDVLCLTIWNGELVAAGDFTAADGNPVSRIARWNGTTWVGIGGVSDFNNDIRGMAVYNGELWVGGDFTNVAGNPPSDRVVKWNGTAWVGGNSGVDIAGGVDSTVRCFYVDPVTNLLYMGGHFTQLNGDANCSRVAVYNGIAWSPLGTGVNDYVRGLTKYNGNIIVGGNFTTAGAVPANKIAKFNPATSTWSAMGQGMNDYVKALEVWNGTLYAGGPFTTADNLSRTGIASWYEAPNIPPVASFTPSATNICLGQCINFTDNSTNTPTSWTWTFNGANPSTSSLQNPNVICYNSPGSYNVTLQACNANGCNTTSQMIVVSSSSIPVIAVSASPSATICTNTSATLTASGATTYTWSPSTGLSATTGSTVVANPPSTTTYTVTGSNGSCTSTQTITVTVNTSPVVSVTPSTMNICPAGSTSLNASGATTYSWLPTTGLSAASGANVTASPSSTTTYTVTGTTSNGCSSTATAYITVGVSTPLPVVEGFETLPFVPANWINVDGGTDGNVWQRNTSVGGYGTSSNCSWFPNNAVSTAGVVDEMRTMTLNFTSLSSAQMTFDVAYCRKSNASFSDTLSVRVSTNCGASWTQLYYVGGSTLATAPNSNSSFTPTAAQWRTETISLNSLIGQSSVMIAFRNHNHNGNNLYIDNINITGVTANPPSPAFTLSSPAICAGSCVTVTDNTSGLPTSWNWLFTGGSPSSSSVQNPGSVCYATAGTYPVRLIACNANGCDTVIQNIIISGPVAATSVSSGVSCFGGSDGTATATPSGGTSPYAYSWSPIGGTNASATGLIAGTYTCLVTDAVGCSATVTVAVTQPSAIASTTTDVNVSCFGDANGSIDLTVTGGTGTYTYDWNSGAYLTQDISGLAQGTYSVVIADMNGCTGTNVVTLTEPPAVAAVLVGSNDPSVCGGSDGAINITVSGGTPPYTYLWSNSAVSQDITGVPAGLYSCTITDANGCNIIINGILNDPNAPIVTLALLPGIVCQSTTPSFTLTGESPTGGIFSGPGVSGNIFDPSTANIGNNIIVYSYTDLNGCTGTASDTIYVDVCTAIPAQPSGEISMHLFPNPSDGAVTILVASAIDPQVSVYDVTGRMVMQKKLKAGISEQLAINAPGVYSVTVTDGSGQIKTARLVICK